MKTDTPAWHTPDESPETGHRIVAIYSDGSGMLFFAGRVGGLIDEDGDERLPMDDQEGIAIWAYLPDHMRLWCEMRGDNPIDLDRDGGAA